VLGLDRTINQTHLRLGGGIHAAFLENRKCYESLFKTYINKINPLHKTILDLEKKAILSPHLKKVITNSYMVRQEILKYYPICKEKISTIHNGVEWEKMQKPFSNWQKDKLSFCKQLNLDPKKFHFLFIGNGFERKGLKQLLLALSLLKEDFHLSVVGKDKNINSFIKFAKKLSLEKKVSFFGPRSDVINFYQLSDSLVIPSFYDPFANVTLEALAMGLFVVSSSSNGGSEVLTKENGTIIESLVNIDSIFLSLKKALDNKKTLQGSQKIRDSIKHLDFSNQLNLFLETLLQ
jgi:UDP-glucose:(heptosyl)LPS alpha-1,3-glucosyltransferase